MPRFRSAAIASLVLLPVVAGAFMLQSRGAQDGARLFDQVLSLVGDRFVDTVDTQALYEKAARGLVHELKDPYSELFSPKQLESFTTRTGGRYGGVGMQIEEQNGNIVVSRVFPHTPAEEGGVREGDRIVAVDTQSTRGFKIAQVSDLLLGTPGTKVQASFQRPGSGEPFKIRFTRAVIHIPAVPYAIVLDGGVGYIPFQGFNETATEEVAEAVNRLQQAGAKGVVLDMRDNPGGILEQALAISNLFMRPGQPIVSVRGRGGENTVYQSRNRALAPTVPLVLLTDGYSASASEIVAGALQDHDRALVIGTTSYGKGLVQSVFPLEGGWALKMTTAKWYTPSGRSIQKERKLNDAGQFVEVNPDSLENDSVKKGRPAYRSDAGRVVYGGGGITPDIIVKSDTITTPEQNFVKSITPKSQQVYVTLYDLAYEMKTKVAPNFTVQQPLRDEFYNRLRKAGVEVDRKLYEQATPYVDRLLENRIARLAFGDSAAKRREVKDDVQLRKALDVLQRAQSQQDLFAIASREQRTAVKP